MRKIRILVVDDSVVIRRLLTDLLSSDPQIEVVGVAPNGRIALAKLPHLNPDLVTLDIEMPEMDGLATLPELREAYPKLPVIMFSTLCERAASATLDALARGATDYVTKPANVGSVTEAMNSVRAQLIPKIKTLCGQILAENDPPLMARVLRPLPKTAPRREPHAPEVVVIGSSTGGPQALSALLSQLPASFPLPIAVVQHMPPVFTKHMADRLNRESPLTIVEAAGGEILEPGKVFIAPGDAHLELSRAGNTVTTFLHQGPPEQSCRPAVDVLFRSAANLYGPACLGVVLTGMGQDGLRGGREIVEHGGEILAQDENSSVVWGMPRAIVEAELASAVLPLEDIASILLRKTAPRRKAALTS